MLRRTRLCERGLPRECMPEDSRVEEIVQINRGLKLISMYNGSISTFHLRHLVLSLQLHLVDPPVDFAGLELSRRGLTLPLCILILRG